MFSGCSKGNISVTIDQYANEIAYESLGIYDGVIAVCNYKTGKLECCVSVEKGNRISEENFNSENNKFLFGQYMPGSTMKIVTTLCTIENLEDYSNLEYDCTGVSDYLSGNVSCQYAHNIVDINKAFGYSCNCFYGKLALSLGEQNMRNTASELGFNRQFRYNGINISKSVFNPHIDDTDFAWSCIGQASSRINPAHYLYMISTIANDGVSPCKDFSISIDTRDCMKLKKMMRSNVFEYYGIQRFHDLPIAGKTGTAQNKGERSSSLFVGFSADSAFPYAIICIMKEAAAQSNKAIDAAANVLQYFAERDNYVEK